MQQTRPLRIILDQDPIRGDWSARFDDQPRIAYRGLNTRQAVQRLLDAHPERLPGSYRVRVDRSRHHTGHFELLLSSAGEITGYTSCPDCRGTGQYVGLAVVEPCDTCGGTGRGEG